MPTFHLLSSSVAVSEHETSFFGNPAGTTEAAADKTQIEPSSIVETKHSHSVIVPLKSSRGIKYSTTIGAVWPSGSKLPRVGTPLGRGEGERQENDTGLPPSKYKFESVANGRGVYTYVLCRGGPGRVFFSSCYAASGNTYRMPVFQIPFYSSFAARSEQQPVLVCPTK